MVRSLRRHDPSATIAVVGHDPLIRRILSEQLRDEILLLTPDDVVAAEPRLKTVSGRSPWERYATQKPVIPLLVLERFPRARGVVTIDADTLFWSSPEPMFAEIGDASIGLSPHRFHPGTAHLAKFGIFNAGCIYWRNDDVGRRCLADWRDDCLAWCRERVDIRGRFMNQGYLGRWPHRYPGVHVIRHPGVNLAPWNLDSHDLDVRGDAVTVDDAPLVFYHFSGVVRDPSGHWHTWYRDMKRNRDLALRVLYSPYVATVEATHRALAREYPLDEVAPTRPLPEGAACLTLPESP